MWTTGLSGTAAAAAAADAGALFLSETSVSAPVTKVCRIAAALSAVMRTESATSPAGSLSTSGCVSLSMLGYVISLGWIIKDRSTTAAVECAVQVATCAIGGSE